ncbi:MAG: MATE family efflux transporter, partial [Hungatella sp.]
IGLAVMFAAGSNAIIARQMGEGHSEKARETFSMITGVGVMVGIAIALLGNLAIVPIVRLLGSSDVLLNDCIAYLRWQLLACPALILQTLFQTYFVTEGKPGIGLFLTVLAGIINVVFDYIFIVSFQMGVAGASLATAMGYMIPSVFGLLYFSLSKKVLWLVRFPFSGKDLLDTCINGSSEMVTNLSSGIITFLFNIMMMRYAGENGVAAITIIQYSQFLLNALIMGFAQGVSPVISFNYGSQNVKQLKQVFKTSITFVLLASLIVFVFSEVMGGFIVLVFAKPGTEVYDLARHGFHIFAISFLFSGISTFASAVFTAFGNGKISAIISFFRTLGLIMVSLIVLPIFLGIDGVWWAVPVAEVGATILSLSYLKNQRNRYQYI